MPDSRPVASVAEFRTLDESDLLLGYAAGFVGLEPQQEWSRGFLHGWRNGMMDSGRQEPNVADFQLAEEFRTLATVLYGSLGQTYDAVPNPSSCDANGLR